MNKTVLISFAIAILVLYVLMFVMLIVVMNRTSAQARSANGEPFKPETKETLQTISPSSGFTEFFNRSLQHAHKVLYGTEGFSPIEGNSQSWLIALALKMNADTKAQIGKALQYGLIDPAIARADEARLRGLAIQQNVPLWFSILADAVNKVVPMQLAGTLSLPTVTPAIESPPYTIQPEKLVTTKKKRKKTANSGPKVIQLHATA